MRTRTSRRWWAGRWLAVLESLGLASRLERGKRYAQSERVLEIDIAPGRVTAHVQGSRYDPYEVRLEMAAFDDAQWAKAIRALGSQALYAAKLLAGEMPREIDEVFAASGLSLFPTSAGELTAECSCPDAANPCKHIAAVYYVLADQFNRDPFLLFRLRGREKKEILRSLRSLRAAEATGQTPRREEPPTLEHLAEGFWEASPALDRFKVSVGPPPVSGAIWKRLGLPEFWRPHPEIRGAFERLYAKVTERAMALAYETRDAGPQDEEG